MFEPVALKYRAFISYSHADTASAKWLHRALESFRIDKELVGRKTAMGTIPTSLGPIFRDRDDFTAGTTLNDQTLAALDDSHALIVICSSDAAKSRYVAEEIRLFKSRHPNRPVIPMIIDGKPDHLELECFPPALKFQLDTKGQISKRPIEVVAADAREEGDGKALALAKVVAGLLGLSSDDIYRRAKRESRRRARFRNGIAAIVGTLALLLTAGGVAWLNQAYLKERYYWFVTMGPRSLTSIEEHALKPRDEFSDCTSGCPHMIVLPAGRFMMGSEEGIGDNEERPHHEVVIEKPFAVGKYEVTFAEWDTCVAAGGCTRYLDTWGRGARPVTGIAWDDAKRYVAWLSRLSGKNYRLLSEAEWEYAARGGTATLYSFGDDEAVLDGYAWYATNSNSSTHPVGEKKPNLFGLHDMHGNVSEWVEDIWHDSYVGAPSDGSAWADHGTLRVIRGGSWLDDPDFLRSANRHGANVDSRFWNGGFRIGRTLTP
jgi:formylglycine-generating enzyme required for sulfatase activity